MRDALNLRGNHALLTRANPLVKFVSVFLISLVLALSIDWVSASTALVAELALFPLAGLTLGLLWQRGLAAHHRCSDRWLEHRNRGG
ncbi:hypothetical protein StoSoilB13_25150 [Arthrobacter sp. StoSoilB13]|nr:hypothetical protein StoSoilB13_25150 [Arthrobacter sp. StoSoilB13]